MSEAVWSPPIPMGSSATQEWRRLDRQTRHALLRTGEPHPDPVIAAVAVGYARTMRARRWNPRRLRVVLWIFVILLAAVMSLALGGPVIPPWAIGGAYALVFIAEIGLRSRHQLRLIRMEQANAPGLLAAEAPGPVAGPASVSASTGERFIARIDGRKMVRIYARLIIIAVVVLALAFLVDDLAFMLPAISMLVLVALVFGGSIVRWRRQRSAVITMDAAGLELPAYRLTAGWPEFTEIRVVPLRSERHRSRVVVLVPADPQALLGRVLDSRLRSARRASGIYGSPVTISDSGLDRTAEEIASAASAFSGLPVRHLSGRPRQ